MAINNIERDDDYDYLPEFFEGGAVTDLRETDDTEMANEVNQILEGEELIIKKENLKSVFMEIFAYYEELFDEATFIDDLHEACEVEDTNIPYTVLEAALIDVLQEEDLEIRYDADSLFDKFIAKLSYSVTIK